MTYTRTDSHQIGHLGRAALDAEGEHTVQTLQASSMADVLGMPPANPDPYKRSLALIVDQSDLYDLEKALKAFLESPENQTNSLADTLEAITGHLNRRAGVV
jgi:hypothetical protein